MGLRRSKKVVISIIEITNTSNDRRVVWHNFNG